MTRTPDQMARLKRLHRVVTMMHQQEKNVLTQLNQTAQALEQESQEISAWMDGDDVGRMSISDFGVLRISKLNARKNDVSVQAETQAAVVREGEGRLKRIEERVSADERLVATKQEEDALVERVGIAVARHRARLP